jgi:hypothetical protein
MTKLIFPGAGAMLLGALLGLTVSWLSQRYGNT